MMGLSRYSVCARGALLAGAISLCLSAGARAEDAERAAADFFETRIRPLLVEKCFRCHGPDEQEGGLRLDSRGGILSGGDSGPAVVAGDPESSRLIDAVRYNSLEMPPDEKLSQRHVDDLVEWVRSGAIWPGSDDGPVAPRAPDVEITDADRQHWSFQPIVRHQPPNDPQTPWDDDNPIDGFVLDRLNAEGLEPAAPAAKATLLRRVYFDLIGLPPTPEEMASFLADERPDAFARVVDDLLARPQYGERWGRHWLDLVRFAQTNGYERDDEKPYIWRYRDYVVRSFNDDKPYDRFVREQLAGDELDDLTFDSLIATGYYRLGVWDDEPDDKQAALHDGLDDILSTTGEVFLGLTIGCARCHDHKFDPIPQADYYRLVAFLQNIAPYGRDRLDTHWELNPDAVFLPLASAEQVAPWYAQQQMLRQKLDDAQAQLKTATDEQKAELLKTISDLKKQIDERPFEVAMGVREMGSTPPPTRLLVRGNHLTPGEDVEPSFLQVLDHLPAAALPVHRAPAAPSDSESLHSVLAAAGVGPTSGRRRALAEWITSPDHPLTARVIVNRIWQHHFGRGLCATPNDFGTTGERPSHPELLDWLASEFMAHGWRIKWLHRQILLSRTYQQASHDGRPVAASDPGNAWLWRQNLRRLEAEAIRDAMLAVTGELNYEMGGRGFFPALSADVLASQSKPGDGWDKSKAAEQARRSVYIYSKRTLGVPLLETFDAPVFERSEPARQSTTIAPQALTLLNSEFVQQRCEAFADRLQREVGDDLDMRFARGFSLALGRTPTPAEQRLLVDFYERRLAAVLADEPDPAAADRRAMIECCRLILNLNEFLYID